jgi:hypothetical protein
MKRSLSIAAKTLVGVIIFSGIFAAPAHSQEKAVYRSEADELITIRKIAILPVFDNLRGIYSRPVENHLIDQLKDNHHFEMAEATATGPILTPEEIEENPKTIAEISQGLQADAFLASKVIKGPSGLSMRMSLFLTKDKKLLAREDSQGFQRLDVESVKKHAAELMAKVLRKLPYDGVVLSRQGTKVTVNLGKKDGILADQLVSVLQIVKLNRHPKFNFLIGSEKEIIGKIKLLKVEDTLSFGRIVTEKENGSIQVNAKIGGLDSVVYSNTDSLSDSKSAEEALLDRPDGKQTFGERPQEWLPQKNPTFGEVGARLGLGSFTENISTTTDSLNSDAPIYPFIVIEGELWLTPKWTMHAGIRQGIISTGNPAPGSPKDLSRSLAAYEFLMGYNIRLGTGAWSPKVELLGGYSTSRLYTDKTSRSEITTKNYGGMKLGVAGSYPLQDDSPWALGAKLFFYFNPKVSEDPGSSGSDDTDIKQFSIFADKKLKINLKARFSLDFDMYSSDFTGGNVRSSSQRSTSASGGLYYLF